MEKLKHKLKGHGGFTLMEMLIVVAIIAILVAISIPLVNSALERAREATDAANERSFKAELTICYLNGKLEVESGTGEKFEVNKVYAFDAAKGIITSGKVDSGYGKSTEVRGADDLDRQGMILVGKIDNQGQVVMAWTETKNPTGMSDLTNAKYTKLIGPSMVDDV